MTRKPHQLTALALLVWGMLAHYMWHHTPPAAQADVWNASMALLQLALLGLLAIAYRSIEMLCVLALLGTFAALTAGCSIAYLVHPWPVEPGAEQCSAALDVPLGLIGLLLGVALAVYIYEMGVVPDG